MLNDRVITLINAEIDGELDPQERDELQAILEQSDEARRLQGELRRLADVLEQLPEQAPPPELAARIMDQVRLPAATQASGVAGGWLASWLGAFQPAQAGLAFAAGLLLTVGFYEISQRGGAAADLSSMVGTMVANPSGAAGRAKDSLSIAEPGLTGTVSLSEVGSFLVLNFDLQSELRTEIEVGLAAAGLGFGGIAHASADSANVTESYEVSGGTLRVVNQGRQVFSVFLPGASDASRPQSAGPEAGGRTISIGISTGGDARFSGVLRG